MSIEAKSFDLPDEIREFEGNGHVDLVSLAGRTLMRGQFDPGWQWSKNVKPIVGGDLCQVSHLGIGVRGRMRIRMADGQEIVLGPGDVAAIPPGHDAWVEGGEPVVSYDLGEIEAYAKPA